MKILVTGASSGIGKRIYNDLKYKGHMPVGVGIGGPDLDMSFDIDAFDESSLLKIFQGRQFDALVNCAGTIELAPIRDHTPAMFTKTLWVNLDIPYMLTWAFLNHLGPVGTGRVVNISSMAVRLPGRECPGYAASKAGLESMTKAIAKELGADHRIVLACVAPGSVAETGMDIKGKQWLMSHRGLAPNEAQEYTEGVFGRQILPSEVSKVVQFCLFDMPTAMTGAVIPIPMASGL